MADALPLVIDETIYQGATWRRKYRWLPGNVAQDFTGWTARLQIRPSFADGAVGEPSLSLTTENDGITLDTDGGITFTATATQTTALTRSTAKKYDLELQAPSGDVTRFVMGTITLSQEITR